MQFPEQVSAIMFGSIFVDSSGWHYDWFFEAHKLSLKALQGIRVCEWLYYTRTEELGTGGIVGRTADD